MSNTTNDLITNIQNGFTIANDEQFNIYTDLFLNEQLKDLRLNLYHNTQQQMNFSNPAEAKHAILKQLFSHFVHNSLTQANMEANNDNNEKATSYVNNLYKLREIFKNHDVVNFQEFLVESDRNITPLEAELLFSKPILNKNELDKLTSAFISAFSKKQNLVSNHAEYQKNFFSHPLIQCLAPSKDFQNVVDSVSNNTLQLGTYKKLIEAILQTEKDLDSEQYLGFITYLISQDLTIGFNNILKLDKYKPASFKILLNHITNGQDINNELLKNVIHDIANEHNVNLSIETDKSFKKQHHSKGTLNDVGHEIKINEMLTFFHAHDTNESGVKQFGQVANTGYNLRLNGQNSIGLGVQGKRITQTESHASFLNKNETAALLNFNILEDTLLSSLQFDADLFGCVHLLNNNIADLKASNYLSSNHNIIKTNIQDSLSLIFNNIGKDDFTLICEKKNAYMHLLEKNTEFFQANLTHTNTGNQTVYQVLSKPLIDFISNTLMIEEQYNIILFNDSDISIIKQLCAANPSFSKAIVDLKKLTKEINMRNIDTYEDIKISSFSDLKNLIVNSNELEKKDFVEQKNIKAPKNNMILNFLSKPTSSLQDCNDKISHLLATQPDYVKKHKKEMALLLKKKIAEQLPLLLPNSQKQKQIIIDINEIIQEVFDCKSADCYKYNSRHTSLTSLLSQSNKTEAQKQSQQTAVQGLLNMLKLTNGKLNTFSTPIINKVIKGK